CTCHTFYAFFAVQDKPRADEADTGKDVRCYTQRIGAIAGAGECPCPFDRNDGEEAGAESNEHERAATCGLFPVLAFPADEPAQKHSENKLENKLGFVVLKEVGHKL